MGEVSTIVGDLVGPLYAEAMENTEELIESYIGSNMDGDILKDKYIAPIMSGSRLILSGVRGTGKTMILKTADSLLKKDLYHKIYEIDECDLKDEDVKIMPVYISYSGFKNDVSLQNETELNLQEIKYAREIFRGYFFISALQQILKVIEDMELDKNVEFNLFGIRTKFGIKREVDDAINSFKRMGFRELIKSKAQGIDIDLKIKPLECGTKFYGSRETTVKEVNLDDMQKTDLFKNTIESICCTYKLDRIMFLFDEVHYLKFLQKEFFDTLFGFRNFAKVSFSVSAYPTFMEYGECFDVPDDAKEVNVAQVLYKPTKNEFETPLVKLVEYRLNKYGKVNYEEVIAKEALEFLILLTNGNPRILLQAIDFIWRNNNQKKILKNSITQDIINEMVTNWYIDFMDKQAIRYKTSVGKTKEFMEVIKSRLNDYNKRNEVATCFFLLNDDIGNNFSDTINLLHYSRIIDKMKISSFGGSQGKMGKMYLLNPMVGWYYGIFTKVQVSNLVKFIKESIEKDKKSQFDSLKTFVDHISEEESVSCPRNIDGKCVEAKCKGTYSEQWTICPFYSGISLEKQLVLPSEININVLNFSYKINTRLYNNGITNLKEVLDRGIQGLKQVYLIGDVRAKNIYYAAKEYIDDNL